MLTLTASKRGESLSAALARPELRQSNIGGLKIDLDLAKHQEKAFVVLNTITERGLSR